MKDICLKNFQSFKSLFKTINYCDANVDYDKFCEYNKENEKRRALSSFFVICAGLDIISRHEMMNIIIDFIEKVKNDITEPDKTNNIEEIVHNIGVMITAGKQFIKEESEYTTILKEIDHFANMNHKQYPSLSSKIVFKFMDLLEELED